MKKGLFICLLFSLSYILGQAQGRIIREMDTNWRFVIGNPKEAQEINFDDNNWQTIDVPHDWSILGKYNRNNPSGRGGGYLPSGIAWYRKSFSIPQSEKGQLTFIQFDGVMENSSVYINGHLLGTRPNGYVSFEYDMTKYLNYGENVTNILALKTDNSLQPSSRFYTGTGIYRHVRLVTKSPLSIAHWGIFVSTPVATIESAKVRVQISLENKMAKAEKLVIRNTIKDAKGNLIKVATSKIKIAPGESPELIENISLNRPQLWDTEHPQLYTLETELLQGKRVIDNEINTFGIRSIRYDAAKGFLLNEIPLKMYGACMHQDGGAVGAAVPLGVWEYRLNLLKKVGVNAIRTAHNPMDPGFYSLCDRMGFLVMDEDFDTWEGAKNHAEKGYNLYFKDWWKTDLTSIVMRDRNHPCIVLYSVGNEIRDNLTTPNGFKKYKDQQDLIHELDTTRPVTMALFRPAQSKVYDSGYADMMDIVGQNYRPDELLAAHKQNPKRIVIGTEDGHDTQTWVSLRDNQYLCGQFLWVGFDYLGEALWPNIGYMQGLFSRIGTWKKQSYQRQTWWTSKPVVYAVRKSVNNGAGDWVRDWTPTDFDTYDQAVIEVYSNTQEVELFINNKSQGRLKMPANAEPARYTVPFKKGELRVNGINENKIVASDIQKTAGEAARIELTASQTSLKKGFENVAYITAKVVDKDGILCPDADDFIQFKIKGDGKIIATDNGGESCKEPYAALGHSAYKGFCAALVRATGTSGKFTVEASAEGIPTGGSVDIDIDIDIEP